MRSRLACSPDRLFRYGREEPLGQESLHDPLGQVAGVNIAPCLPMTSFCLISGLLTTQAGPQSRSDDLEKLLNRLPARVESLQGRHPLAAVAQIPVRVVFDDIAVILGSKLRHLLPALDGVGYSRRVMEGGD